MKKMLSLCFVVAFVLGGAPVFAADPENPCVKPAVGDTNPNGQRNYESCMAEYDKSLKLTGKDRDEALARAKSIMNDTENLEK